MNLPKAVRAELLQHLAEFVALEPAALLFTGERDGNAVRRPSFVQRTKWTKVVADLGLTGLHFHDLRHAATTTVHRRRALRSGISRRIADRLSKLVDKHRSTGKRPSRKAKRKPSKKRRDDGDDGAAGVLVPAR